MAANEGNRTAVGFGSSGGVAHNWIWFRLNGILRLEDDEFDKVGYCSLACSIGIFYGNWSSGLVLSD